MKDKVKEILSNIVYWLYEKKFLKNKIKVQTVDETIDELLTTNKSLVRFGDGEIVVLKGTDIGLQQTSTEISEGLKRILAYPYDDLMVALQGEVFDNVKTYHKKSQKFWKEHLFFCRKIYHRYCNLDRIYANTCFSRFYYVFNEKKDCDRWISKIKLIWKNKDVVIVEGVKSHNGVGNDLFDNANSIERIICPPKNAMDAYEEILKACEKYPKDRLFLLSVGVTSKFLAEALFLKGYRVIDIGNLDIEYEWYLHKAKEKVFYDKYLMESIEDNMKAGYSKYLAQIKQRIVIESTGN